MNNPFKTLSRTIRAPFNKRAAFKRLAQYQSEPHSLEEVVLRAMNFGGSGYFRVKTMQIPQEITALAKAVSDLKPKTILEIGTSRAGTLLIWASIASERVITCDIQEMHVQEEFLKSLKPLNSNCEITPLSGNSHSSAFKQKVIETLAGNPVDFLFIDGDHTAEGVTADFNDYKDLVRPGGIIAFHDIVESQPLETNQVYDLWKHLRKEHNVEEFVADKNQRGFGIGIIRVPE